MQDSLTVHPEEQLVSAEENWGSRPNEQIEVEIDAGATEQRNASEEIGVKAIAMIFDALVHRLQRRIVRPV